MSTEIKILQNLDEISRVAAELFIEIGNRAINQNDKFTVALAGGSTPKSLYQLLATDEFKNQIDRQKVFFFFGDERNVSPDSDESNFKTADENLLKPLQISAENVFRWQTELADSEKIAENYSKTIVKFFDLTNEEFPRFDLILLGMGDDGHTASLFPLTDALNETEKIAVSNHVEKLDANRLTFTFPTLNNAANVIFLISGVSKTNALKEVLEGKSSPEKFPSQNVNPQDGNLFWLIDAPAAQFLK
ncbi:MAG: 6-phosphogluconolactonase [Acidobacteriota bacterium]